MNLDRRKTGKGTEDGGADVIGSPSAPLRDISIVVAVTALIFCLIELLCSIALVIKHRDINDPPTRQFLAGISLLSPFVDKKKEICREIYVKAPQPANAENMMEESLLRFRLIPDSKYCFKRDLPLPAEAFITNKEGFISI